jgi:hypothetical protein
MLTDIEEGIVARLDAKLTGVNRVAIDEAHTARNLNVPVVDVIVGGGGFVRVAQQFKITPQVFVIVTFQNLRSVADRRKGVYPILLAILSLLVGNKLGLKIDALVPKRLDNITEEKEAKEGKVVFQLEFETGFIVETLSDEVITDLFRVGLQYYLQPDDGIVDAAETIIVQAPPEEAAD